MFLCSFRVDDPSQSCWEPPHSKRPVLGCISADRGDEVVTSTRWKARSGRSTICSAVQIAEFNVAFLFLTQMFALEYPSMAPSLNMIKYPVVQGMRHKRSDFHQNFHVSFFVFIFILILMVAIQRQNRILHSRPFGFAIFKTIIVKIVF